MQDNPLTIEEQERYAIDNYAKQRENMSGALRKQINKTMNRETLINGVASAVAIGFVLGTIYSQANAHISRCDENGRKAEYKWTGRQMTESILKVVSIALLASFILSGVKAMIDSNNNNSQAKKLAFDTFRKSFDSSLNKYLPKNQQALPLHETRATAMILANMSQTDIDHLQELAKTGLIRGINGNFSISQEAITATTKIVSDFVNANPDIGINICKIMHGEKPTTYYLTNLDTQKTR